MGVYSWESEGVGEVTSSEPQSEAVIQADIRLQCSVGPTRLFRNNIGTGWVGGKATIAQASGMMFVNKGDVIIPKGRLVKYGVCNPGGSDLLGWHSVIVTPDMVGQKIAIFVAPEIKRPGEKATLDQKRFHDAVNNAGGRAGVADSVEAAQKIISLPPEKKLL